ncbi:MAG TPA: hypothetical protein VM884_10475, partial [Flavisolibacter sp.]|nr:hypothetical protein [Flavisolibacter sp.]
MTEVKGARPKTDSEAVVERAKNFWDRFGKTIAFAIGAVVLLTAGIIGYKRFVKDPKEKKGYDAIFKAQEYYGQDSLDKALKGDGQYPGFEKIADQYGGTAAGDLAHFYAG